MVAVGAVYRRFGRTALHHQVVAYVAWHNPVIDIARPLAC